MSGPYPVRAGRRYARNAYVLNLTPQQVGALVGASFLLLVLAFLLGYVVGQARGGAPPTLEEALDAAAVGAGSGGAGPSGGAEVPEPPPAPVAAAAAPAPAEAPREAEPRRAVPTAAAPAPRPSASAAPATAARPTAARASAEPVRRYSIVVASYALGDSPAAVSATRAKAREIVERLKRQGFAAARTEEVALDAGRYLRVIARDVETADRAGLDRIVEGVKRSGYPGAWHWTRE